MTDTKEAGTREAETISLSPEALKVAEEIRVLSGLPSLQDAIRLALGDELYFRRKLHEGYRVLVNRADDYREVDLTVTQ